ncbi:MAG: hypothetical protein HY912_09250 [Desulfomonile tiedjei]|uniref:Uncharacterized protein n=1 Tax=Desulfomonile tiedjei TaxID=2358 RepID=A0A9D6V0I5_9BACT|nr:hypothetical protein [Desulfomonile tiedjei]
MKTIRNSGPLPVMAIIRQAIAICWLKRAVMFRALLPAALFLIASHMLIQLLMMKVLGPGYAAISGIILVVVVGMAFAVFAVTCHRLIIMGDDSVSKYGLSGWSPRETRFVGWLLLGYVCFLAVGAAVGIPVFGLALLLGLPSRPWVVIVTILVTIPCVYVFARISILLPATAVDERPNIKWAVDTTENNGWRLVLIVSILPLVLDKFPAYLLGYSVVADFAIHVVECVLYAVEIACLSLSYQHLTGRVTYGSEVAETLLNSESVR